ncbi:hypothetical protein D9M68_668290 [compost metagenome]
MADFVEKPALHFPTSRRAILVRGASASQNPVLNKGVKYFGFPYAALWHVPRDLVRSRGTAWAQNWHSPKSGRKMTLRAVVTTGRRLMQGGILEESRHMS